MRKKSDDGFQTVDLTWKAYHEIRKMLFMNEIGQGQKLNHQDLAARLGMSRTPIVQALKCMELQGLVRNEPNRGFYVNYLGIEELTEIFDLRRVIEVSLPPDIVRHMTPDGARRLNASYDVFLEASRKKEFKKRLYRDMEFHLALAELARRPVFQQILGDLLDRLYLRFEQETLFSRPMEKAETEHRHIVDCLLKGDAATAATAISEHLDSIRDNAIECFRRRLAEKESLV